MAVDKKKSAEVEQPVKVSSLEAEIIEAFMSEFKGLPGTELSVVVRCGRQKAPTYQEIELPAVRKILESAVKQ